jgi:adenosylcobinamide-phosphate synthase
MTDSSFIAQLTLLATPFLLSITLALALMFDYFLGEPKKYHQLVGFGNLANLIEKILNNPTPHNTRFCQSNAMLGAIAWCVLILPICYLSYYLLALLPLSAKLVIEAIFLYLAIGLNSLNVHAMQVFKPLMQKDLTTARHYTGYLVSRETTNLSPEEMSRATVESMLENGHDAVIASLVYFIIGGIPLVILHSLANTLDAMWGDKNTRFKSFCFFAARADDILGFVSGKICTLLYALQRPFVLALKNAYQQGNQYKSHNGGWVMAAGATVMQRALGGEASYHGKTITSPTLGVGDLIKIEDIPRSIAIVQRAAILLVLIVFIYQLTSSLLV